MLAKHTLFVSISKLLVMFFITLNTSVKLLCIHAFSTFLVDLFNNMCPEEELKLTLILQLCSQMSPGMEMD